MIACLLRGLLLMQLLTAGLLSWWLVSRWGTELTTTGAIVIGFMVVALGYPWLITLQFIISRIYKSPVPAAHRLSWWQAIMTLDREFDASVRTFFWAQSFRAGRPVPSPTKTIQPLPVLFIHGYFCNEAVWQPLMREAAQRGYLCGAVRLEPAFCSIDDYADPINAALEQLLAKHGSAFPDMQARPMQAILVGHSMGGLAARAFMRRHGDAAVARLITLGTPHDGTVLARYVRTTNGLQMRDRSIWTSVLAASESPQLRKKISAIFSYHDNVVAPQISGSLDGANNIAVSGVGHIDLVYAPHVRDLLFAEIAATQATNQEPGELNGP